ncbi:ABC transporter permease [Lacticaseibacillus chiayiensis]|uniref:ABC transporter permease n=1 Tax=Lacticaseibacillus chiayiensis TaxID=2100821 RepID=A0ABY6H3L4_9LACO|nr:ABC transporter permease [Lacticaseibacillus chiayiensis]UYN55936.1 ABC transporter permease [Lacticaseibacillus chiayiensis]
MRQLNTFFQRQVAFNQKNIVAEIFMALLVVGSFFVIKIQKIADLKVETFRIQQSVQSSYLRYDARTYSKTSSEGKMLQALNRQLSGTGKINSGLLLQDDPTILNGQVELAQAQLKSYALNFAGAHGLLIPTKESVIGNLAVARKLQTDNGSPRISIKTAADYGTILFQVIAICAPFLIIYLVGDSWLIELEHTSVLKNMPVSFSDKLVAHVKASFQLAGCLFLGLPAMALLLLGLVVGFGNWSYPTAFNLMNKITTVPFWLAALLIVVYCLTLTIFFSLVAIWLNKLTGNFYATVLSIATILVLVTFSRSLPSFLYLTPIPYLNVMNIYSGRFLLNNHLPIGWLTGIGVLLIWTLAIWLILSRQGSARNE